MFSEYFLIIMFKDVRNLIWILGGYLLTQKDVFFDRTHASQIISAVVSQHDQNTKIELPPPAILRVRQ